MVQAIRLPQEAIEQQLLLELSTSLYGRALLSLGKARELAGMGEYDFARELGRRKITRHYGRDELADDLAYAGRQ